ncbi:hypothetical protein EB796_021694 [Bugula neritina]|uniref:Uncharacterized protein n=1 Tax=Bugula neritina TaxID=10212 RepID=A0A7J7J3J2_BUGNE|nr:hypothetical protein EB796_021694 [Bugula neritina]
MGEDQSCMCYLLGLSSDGNISAWDEFSSKSAPRETLEPKVQSTLKRPPTILKVKKVAKDNTEECFFQHNLNHRQHIQDYRNLTCFKKEKSELYPVLSQYDSSNRLLDRQSMANNTIGKENTFTSLNNSSSNGIDLNLSVAVKDPRRQLTYEDIKSYIDDKAEADECMSKPSLLKPKKPVNINLTGKFVQRTGSVANSISRCVATNARTEQTSSRKPKDDAKLPIPLRPAPLVSYKMPSSLKCKVTIERLPTQSAKNVYLSAKSCNLDISKSSRPNTNLSKTSRHSCKSECSMHNAKSTQQSSLNRRSLDSLTYTSGFNGVRIRTIKKEPSTLSNTLDDDRKKHLQALVKILGDRMLAPCLNNINVEPKAIDFSAGLGKAEAIDYNVIFGSRI